MDATHFHLAMTHLPIFGTLIGLGVFAFGVVKSQPQLLKAGLVIFVLMSLVTIPVYLSGEAAEETIEALNAAPHEVIHEHEELAEKAIWLMFFLGGLSIVNFMMINGQKASVKIVNIITLVTAIATFVLFANVGGLGGEIRHSEIREAPELDNVQAPDRHSDLDDD